MFIARSAFPTGKSPALFPVEISPFLAHSSHLVQRGAFAAQPAADVAALPRRISRYGENGRCTLATTRPTEMLKPPFNPGIRSNAREVEHAMIEMMLDAADGS